MGFAGKNSPSPLPLRTVQSEILCLKEGPSVSAVGLEQAPALSFNFENLPYCQPSTGFCFSPFFSASNLQQIVFVPLFVGCWFPHARRKILNKSEGSLCIIGERECLIQLNGERVRPKLKFFSAPCLTNRASSIVNHWPQEGYLVRTSNKQKPHNPYLLNYLYLYRVILCVLIMGLSKPASYCVLYSVTFE